MNSQVLRFDSDAVANAMLQRAMTRNDLKERSGLSLYTVWKTCNGKRVSLATGKAIARALRVSLASLRADAKARRVGAASGGETVVIGNAAEISDWPRKETA